MSTQLNKAHIMSLAVQYGIDIDPDHAKVNESGLDFYAVFAQTKEGTPWVLRTPRRPDVVVSAAYEKKVLDLIAGKLPVAVPDWRVSTEDLIAYPMLVGTPVATINPETNGYDWYIDPGQLPDHFDQSLAEALVALHGVDHREAEEAGVRVRQPAEVRKTLSDRMDEIKQKIGVSSTLWARWQAWLADGSYWPDHSVLVHGDLHPGHIVVNPQGQVTGLLDWTEAEVTDPATDFTLYYALFGESGLSKLLKLYEQAGGRVWPRMSEHIIELMAAYPISIATFALKSGLQEYLTMARGALGVNEQGEELSTE